MSNYSIGHPAPFFKHSTFSVNFSNPVGTFRLIFVVVFLIIGEKTGKINGNGLVVTRITINVDIVIVKFFQNINITRFQA